MYLYIVLPQTFSEICCSFAIEYDPVLKIIKTIFHFILKCFKIEFETGSSISDTIGKALY